jgi:hypothetical protein
MKSVNFGMKHTEGLSKGPWRPQRKLFGQFRLKSVLSNITQKPRFGTHALHLN